MTTLVDIYGFCIGCLVIVLFLAPIDVCTQWIKRGSSDGYPSVGMIFGLVSFTVWLNYGRLKPDYGMVLLNAFGLVSHIVYTLIYDYHQSNKKHLHIQLAVAGVFLASVFLYVWEEENAEAKLITMGRICSLIQSSGCMVGFYGLYYTISIKTSEYMPFKQTTFASFVCFNALIFSLLLGDIYMIIGNLFNATLTCANFSMYFIYPPRTWLLPWQKSKLTTSSSQKAEEDKEKLS